MARVKFIEDFDYKPTAQVTVAYLAGWSGTVKHDCAEKAVAADKAVFLDGKSKRDVTVDRQASDASRNQLLAHSGRAT
ncbi:hypothetical protein [Shinella zoogloeoides]|uniref:hypothetical protein n=1 Tax=Shinella zoogloeoides TaxID=352475 RepID=UPI00273F4AF4|nr:hypothetical protein [Shinella zoogloeoides]WLR94242.1 hypothetical protein Q9316_08765 [Shinella zoogloeoides]